MSTCICILKTGLRKGKRCHAKTKYGQFCGRHINCAITEKSKNTDAYGLLHDVVFTINYRRTSKNAAERDPSAAALERYIAASSVIPENITYFDDYSGIRTTRPKYIGKRRFQFKCQSNLSLLKIAKLVLTQSLADSEWGAQPGNGSFVYPTKDGLDELGVLYFESVVVDGKEFQ